MDCGGGRMVHLHRFGLVALLWLAFATFAAAAELRILVDNDNNPATGCTVPLPASIGGSFAGVEEVLITTVDTSAAPAIVRGIDRRVCVNGALSAPVTIDASTWPVGAGVGVGGYDAIETYVPLAAAHGSVYRLGFVYDAGTKGADVPPSTQDGTGARFEFTTAKLTAADPGNVSAIPTLAHGALFLLALLVAGVALYTLRRYKAPLMLVVAVLAVVVTGTTWAAIALDGLIADWDGVPALATDAVGDAPRAADLSAVFAVFDAAKARLYVRADVKTMAGMSTAAAVGIATTTTVSSSVNPSAVGQAVTFTANVSAVGGPGLTGTITFMDGATPLGPNVALVRGSAQLTTAALTAGSHAITAVYSGDANYAPGTSGPLTQVVNKSATSSTVTSSANPSPGGDVTFTATVTGPASLPKATGTVSFSDGATVLAGAIALDAAGKAMFTTSLLAKGSHSITVTYGGNVALNGSTSPPLTQVMTKNPSATALVAAPNPSAPGQPVTLTATVTAPSGGGTPTGVVYFRDGAVNLGRSGLNAAGVATLVTSALGNGGHSLTAFYEGDANFGPSTSPPISQIVNSSPIAINDAYSVVHDTPLVVPVGTGILANDTLGIPPAPGVGTVTGSGAACAAFPCAITTTHGTATVNLNGSFVYTPAALFAGTDTFTYTISNVSGTSGATVTITVTDVPPVVDLSGPPAGIDFGPVTFTEGGGPIAIVDSAQLTVTDTDNATLASATVVITNLLDGASELLSVTCPTASPGCSGAILAADVTYTPATGTLLINKVAPLADYQVLLRTLRYDNASQNPNTTTRDISVTVNDGIVNNSPLAHSLVNIIAVNNPPTVNAPATASTPPNTPIVFNGNVSVADPDAGSNPVKVTLTATNGIATLSGTGGLVVVGNGTASVVATGPLVSQNVGAERHDLHADVRLYGPGEPEDRHRRPGQQRLRRTEDGHQDDRDHGRRATDGDHHGAGQWRGRCAACRDHHDQLQRVGQRDAFVVQARVPGGHAEGVHDLGIARGELHADAERRAATRHGLYGHRGRGPSDRRQRRPEHGGGLRFQLHGQHAAHRPDHRARQRRHRRTGGVGHHGELQRTGQRDAGLVHAGMPVRHAESVYAVGVAGFKLHADADRRHAHRDHVLGRRARSGHHRCRRRPEHGGELPVLVHDRRTAGDHQREQRDVHRGRGEHVHGHDHRLAGRHQHRAGRRRAAAERRVQLWRRHHCHAVGHTAGRRTGRHVPAHAHGEQRRASGRRAESVHADRRVSGDHGFAASLADGMYNAAYGPVAFSASGGSGAYSFALGSGSAAGIGLRGANLQGTPIQHGHVHVHRDRHRHGDGLYGIAHVHERQRRSQRAERQLRTDDRQRLRRFLVRAGVQRHGNDQFPAGATITAFDATSTQGGTVTMTTSGANIGQFTYDPPRGSRRSPTRSPTR